MLVFFTHTFSLRYNTLLSLEFWIHVYKTTINSCAQRFHLATTHSVLQKSITTADVHNSYELHLYNSLSLSAALATGWITQWASSSCPCSMNMFQKTEHRRGSWHVSGFRGTFYTWKFWEINRSRQNILHQTNNCCCSVEICPFLFNSKYYRDQYIKS
jgi:hypothetical protein